jgi:putative endonuclease
MVYVYILYSKLYNRYYIGQSEDITQRILRHNNKQVPSTRAYVPWEVIYSESFITRALACKREKEIKGKKSRNYIEFLRNKN